jgi:hypothetical protein
VPRVVDLDRGSHRPPLELDAETLECRLSCGIRDLARCEERNQRFVVEPREAVVVYDITWSEGEVV